MTESPKVHSINLTYWSTEICGEAPDFFPHEGTLLYVGFPKGWLK